MYIDSRYGYKIKMNHNGHRQYLITSGFRYRNYEIGNPPEPIVIQPGENGAHREIWLGYHNIPEDPEIALQDIIHYLSEIKTRYWTYSYSNDEWIKPDRPVQLQFGEAVSLIYTHDQPKTLVWRTRYDVIPIEDDDNSSDLTFVIPPQPEYFIDFEEQADYIPIYVILPDNMVGYDEGELALFIDDVLYGSTVIYGQLVQIRAYIIGIDLDNANIEFRFYQYGPRSSELMISDYQVYDEITKSYRSGQLDFSERRNFYQISLIESSAEIKPPSVTMLEGNFPNPFNPTTTINYSLAESGAVRLQIFNIRGQLVKSIVDEFQDAGFYAVEWHGTDIRGLEVASGIYFYRLETSAGRDVRRMVLLK